MALFTTLAAALAALTIFCVLYRAALLFYDIRRFRSIGIPCVVLPISNANPLMLVYPNHVKTLIRPFLRLLPAQVRLNSERFNRGAWEANELYKVHAEYGDVFALLAPGRRQVFIADPTAAADVIRSRDDFPRDMQTFKMLNVYGDNLISVHETDWQKHRKITAAAFTERNTRLVWAEALRQAQDMLRHWTRKGGAEVLRTAPKDINTFSVNVIAAALFAQSHTFRGVQESTDSVPVEKPLYSGYRDSLAIMLQNIYVILIFGGHTLRKSWMPNTLRRAGNAVEVFRSHAMQMIKEEKEQHMQAHKRPDSPSLVNLLVRASEEAGMTTGAHLASPYSSPSSRGKTLTEDEIVSNLFAFAFAGNDTTAITLHHALAFLAVYPELQDWIHEETTTHLKDDDIATWDYQTVSKLKRCLAVILETLRVVPPVSLIVKRTERADRVLTVQGTQYTLPAYTVVSVNVTALHTNPAHWGADAYTFNPRRFILTSATTNDDTSAAINETILPDTSPSFMPWATGARVCPGKRFAQVEMVAALARLSYSHRIEVVQEEGESMEEARKRMLRLNTTIHMPLLLDVVEPERMAVRWVRR